MRAFLVLLILIAVPGWAQELTLDQARALALQNSHVLREYRARVGEAGFQIDEAYSLGNPTLGITANTNYLTPTVQIPIAAPPVQVSEHFNYSVGITLRQALYTFGRLHWRTQAAELTARARQNELLREQNRVLEEVTLAYVDVLEAQARVQVAEENLRTREEALSNAREMLESGLVPRFDVVRDEALVARAEEARLEARNQSVIARATLFSLTGTSDRQQTLVAPEEGESPPSDLAAAQARARELRPELGALNWSVEAARARVELAASEDNPTLGFETTYQRRNPVAFNKADQWVSGLTLSIPLFDGGLADARTGQAEEVVKQLEASRDEIARQVALEVERLYSDLQTRHARVQVAERGLAQAEEAARVARLRYSEGISINLELLDTESALTQARLELVNSRYDYLAAWARWRRATAQPPFAEASRHVP